ncbi:MAG TPA: thioredoxin fold domain-containing protein [Petrotogaceae bacterium]|jgi:thioredoxin-related protein|nr:thioredoxin fold domain-containing protein [Petrotogaceae bacterium]HNV06350.1 thioredoxin fold domain-containing protein [Petrotogaceae bacterium]HNY37031.1 thioredoxin fold domain-containing protein [Petrotogaceae bacterium]HPG48649.1 thioredoxin fold domain-containing protein [Petrotogaceae bacterium]HQC41578.1 thioredoxin fold domain-containing protein [Petrotogaceae bacterium]
MKRGISFLLILFGAVLTMAATSLKDFSVIDFDNAFKISELTGKKVVVMFTSDDCYYCKKFEDETLTDPTIIQWLKTSFIFTQITSSNIKTAKYNGKTYTYSQLFGAFGVRGTPTFAFFSKTEYFGTVSGFMDATNFMNILKYLQYYEKNKDVSMADFIKSKTEVPLTKKILSLPQQDIDLLLKIDPNVKAYAPGLDKYTNVIAESSEQAEKLENYLIFIKK